MTVQSIRDFDAAAGLQATGKETLAKLVKAWESQNSQRAARVAGLGLMAVSLAACGGSDPAPTVAPPTPPVDPITAIPLTSGQDLMPTSGASNDNYFAANGTLTSGDRINTTGKVTLDLNGVSLDGQTINASEIAIDASNGVTIEASDWTAAIVRVFDSLGNVTVNDLQSLLTRLVVEDHVGATNTVTFNFDATILAGASVASLSVSEVNALVALSGGNIETVNLAIADRAGATSSLTDFTSPGLTTLNIAGGTAGLAFGIVGDLDAGITTLNASTAASNLTLSIASSTTAINAALGSGNDSLHTGDTIGDLDEQDRFDGNAGSDTLTAVFTTAGTRNPISSEIETFTLTFDNSATVDFSEVNDVATINVLESGFRAQLIDMDNTVKTLNVSGDQTGDWDIDYERGEEAVLNVNWANNTGSDSFIDSIEFDEVESLDFDGHGDDDVFFGEFILDKDVTTSVIVHNEDNGDLNLAAQQQGVIDTADSVVFLTVQTSLGGDIHVGAISDLQSLERLNVSASASGDITIGDLGLDAEASELEFVSIKTAGGDVTIGDLDADGATISTFEIIAGDDSDNGIGVSCGGITAQDISEMNIEIEQDATVELGDLNLVEQGDVLTASGEGTLDPIVFTDEAFALMDLSALSIGTTIDFRSANLGSTVLGTQGHDMIYSGAGDDVIHGNGGTDILYVSRDGSLDNDTVVFDYRTDGNDTIVNFVVDDNPAGGLTADADVIELHGIADATELKALIESITFVNDVDLDPVGFTAAGPIDVTITFTNGASIQFEDFFAAGVDAAFLLAAGDAGPTANGIVDTIPEIDAAVDLLTGTGVFSFGDSLVFVADTI